MSEVNIKFNHAISEQRPTDLNKGLVNMRPQTKRPAQRQWLHISLQASSRASKHLECRSVIESHERGSRLDCFYFDLCACWHGFLF